MLDDRDDIASYQAPGGKEVFRNVVEEGDHHDRCQEHHDVVEHRNRVVVDDATQDEVPDEVNGSELRETRFIGNLQVNNDDEDADK